jgi:AAA15 family ATPase/GTPase
LVGGNNAGKTTILDAIALFCRPLDISNWREVAWRREIKSARTPLTEPFKWMFPQSSDLTPSSDLQKIVISGIGSFPGRRLWAEYSKFESFETPPAKSTEDTEDQLDLIEEEAIPVRGLELKVLSDYAQRLDGQLDETRVLQSSVDFRVIDNQRFTYSMKVENPYLNIGFISPVTHRTSQDTTTYLSQALRNEGSNENIRKSVTEILREIDPDVEKFEIVDTGQTTSTILIKHRKTGMTPISAFGDGMRRALLIAAILPALKNGVLLIDEIETALHVSALSSVLQALAKAAKKYNVQVFATTHSLEAVDAIAGALKESLNELVAYRIENDEQGRHLTRYTGELVHRLRFERGIELR